MSTAALGAEALQATMMAALAGSVVDPMPFERTDAGNALLFVAMYKGDIRYIEAWRTWACWNGKRWELKSDTALMPLARQVTEHMFEWAGTLPDGDQRDSLRKHALATQREQRLHAMINLAKGEPGIRAEPDQFDADPWLLGCEDFTFDLRARKPRAPRREDFITKSTGIVPDRNAVCPNWFATLDRAMGGDAETIEHLQRVAGYMLTGSVSEEKLFALFGTGANGKTTFAMTLFEALGDYAAKGRRDLLLQSQGEKGSASPDVAALHGKRLVVVSETDDGCALAEAQVKEITSNEPITARKLHRDPFTFHPSHKVLLMTNHRPFVTGTDEGIWRRLNIVGFAAKIADRDQDPHFREEKLHPELPAILAWMIKGCFMWQRDGLKPSAAVTNETKAYRSEMDFIQQWLDERTIADPQASIPRSEAYNDYTFWSEREHMPTLGNRRFVGELEDRGFARAKSNGVRLFKGFRLQPPVPAPRVVSETRAKP
jgi:putative DNA primase/helicase